MKTVLISNWEKKKKSVFIFECVSFYQVPLITFDLMINTVI